MAMSRKHYVAVAEILAAERSVNPDAALVIDNIAKSLSDVFYADNGHFDRGRFYTAAGVDW